MEPYIGEIRLAGFNFAPAGWAICAGQLLSIAQNTVLFSLLGTRFGGDGNTTFGLPDLRGRIPIQAGQAFGLSPYELGARDGDRVVTLTKAQIPTHRHQMIIINGPASSLNPAGKLISRGPNPTFGPVAAAEFCAGGSISHAGEDAPHNNMMPYIGVNYIIALQGIFPPRPGV